MRFSVFKRVYPVFRRKQILYDLTNRLNTVATHSNNKNNYDNGKNNDKYFKYLVNGTALSILIAYGIYENQKNTVQLKSDKEDIDAHEAGAYRPNFPNYTAQQVAEHSTQETGIWVTYKEGVYDITNFIPQHPGGDHILMAAGSSVEPFWLLYGVHKNKDILELLESMRIGNVSAEESKHFTKDLLDPYDRDPSRHKVLICHSQKPYNGEPPAELLVQSFYTPNEIFYIRNHLPVPLVDVETYQLEVEVEGSDKVLTLTLDDIKKLPKHTVSAAIMCAGNRRSDMADFKQVKGLNWGPAAIGNATWTGVLLRDVLKLAGINENSEFKHVQFEGLDIDGTGNPYGASIPIWKAVDRRGDVVLAYEMNGQPLSRDHGFPLRAVVPGTVGARNVKWLGKIIVSNEESQSHWQQNDYKGFSPTSDWNNIDYSRSPAIQELPVISAICIPRKGEVVKVSDGHMLVQGYAWSGGGQKIIRVDVTIDGGNTWHVANIDFQEDTDSPKHWSWTLWSVKVPVDKCTKKVEIWAKAVDSCYNTQPESFQHIWNMRGVLSNGFHRVPIQLIQ